MDIQKLQRAIVDGLEDVKGQDILVFNTEHLSPLFERVIIASGTSNRQTKALAASVRDAVKAQGFATLRTEGEDNGEWIIVDCGAAVVHVMQPSIREYYHLEEIWGDKPVRIKLGSTSTQLVKASEPEAPAKKTAATKKTAAAKSALPKKATTKTVAAKTVATKAAAPKTAAPKASAKKLVTKKVAAKSTAAKPVAAKTTPAKKTPARTTPAKTIVVKPTVTRTVGVKSSAAAKKTPVKKAPAKTPAARKSPRSGKA
jgi:ribosome-associated protein